MKRILFLLVCFFFTSCQYPISDYYNGYASIRAFAKKDKEKREAFYAKQTPRQKALDIENRRFCRKHLTLDSKGKWYSETNEQMEIYLDCMRKKGTVFYFD